MRLARSLLFFSAALFACGGRESTPPPTTPATPTTPTTSTQVPSSSVLVTQSPEPGAGKPQPGKSYALVVSFISPGNGTDDAAYERLRAVISDVGAAKVGHAHGHWGKEGEHDECFELQALSFADKKAFLQRVRLATSSDRVTIAENARCRNDRHE